MIPLHPAFDRDEFLFAVALHLRFEPVMNLGSMKAPFTANLLAREIAAAGPLTQIARIAILAFGTLLYPALQAAESLGATVVNMRWAKPIDEALLREVAERHDALVTLEEGAIMGGAGSAVTEALNAMGIVRPVLQLGLADVFIEHGDPAKLLALQGLLFAWRYGELPAEKVCHRGVM